MSFSLRDPPRQLEKSSGSMRERGVLPVDQIETPFKQHFPNLKRADRTFCDLCLRCEPWYESNARLLLDKPFDRFKCRQLHRNIERRPELFKCLDDQFPV